jgi:single-strand DNA-binding protein
MNKVILIGNLVRDPERTETANGVAVCRFSIAVSRPFSNADGDRETDFFNITTWRGQAENCCKYLKKGNKIAVVGILQTRTYEDKDGVKKYATDIIANEVEFLTPKPQASEEADEAMPKKTRFSGQGTRKRPTLDEAPDDDNIPF